MAKVDNPSLLTPGIHQMSDLDFFQMTVSAFPGDPRRAMLYGLFATWANGLRGLGIGGTMWIDGSFMTSKAGPEDIDLVLWVIPPAAPLSPVDQQKAQGLIDKSAAKYLYGLDLYVERVPAAPARMTYWGDTFGTCHDGVTKKGIAEVLL